MFIFIDVDECANDTLNNCSDNATCVDLSGSHLCYCNAGYTGNGTFCFGIKISTT